MEQAKLSWASQALFRPFIAHSRPGSSWLCEEVEAQVRSGSRADRQTGDGAVKMGSLVLTSWSRAML